ncbi:YtzI protein [Bacillus sp. FJAT-49736]|uniref:YtzI protein n=1 Tax=Bacillus sp. FJAT-49736 TaxID=2833582 RepID=UPI001BC93F2A|nr:YtzI protein [Bacillus sp. FJAT-49736]MBS4173897.1 YtzI protein [Bacillus sp. FJAT-49736]
MFTLILVVSLIIIVIIMSAAVITTSKAYSYKHTVDPIENNPNIKRDEKEPSNH